jgi:hypothetical protein
MTTSSPEPREPGQAEQPTPAAQVRIETERGAWVKLSARQWITGEGTVPPREARYLIAMIGMVTCAVSGIGGAVLTPGSASERAPVVFAELVLALVVATLVAVGYFRRGAPAEGDAPQVTGEPVAVPEKSELGR